MEKEERLTFDQLPDMVSKLIDEIYSLRKDVKVLSGLCNTAIDDQQKPVVDNHILMNTEETCGLLKCSRRTLYKYVEDGHLPYVKRGGRLGFFKDEVIAWCEDSRVQVLETKDDREDRFLAMMKKDKAGLDYLL